MGATQIHSWGLCPGCGLPTPCSCWPENQPEPPKKQPESSGVPDLTDYLLGWRSWQLTPGGALLSANGHYAWKPGVNEAACLPPPLFGSFAKDHPAPDERCACGFYGWITPDVFQHRGACVGLIQAWGDVVLHPHGLRAQYARIVAVCTGGVGKLSGYPDAIRYATVRELIEDDHSKRGQFADQSMLPEPDGSLTSRYRGYYQGSVVATGTTAAMTTISNPYLLRSTASVTAVSRPAPHPPLKQIKARTALTVTGVLWFLTGGVATILNLLDVGAFDGGWPYWVGIVLGGLSGLVSFPLIRSWRQAGCDVTGKHATLSKHANPPQLTIDGRCPDCGDKIG